MGSKKVQGQWKSKGCLKKRGILFHCNMGWMKEKLVVKWRDNLGPCFDGLLYGTENIRLIHVRNGKLSKYLMQ